MVKKILIFALFPFLLSAANLDKKIESYLGKSDFFVQKNLVDILFSNKNQYLNDDNSTNDIAILAQLKKSGLLKLFYSKPVEMKISFKTNGNSLIFMRVINESLEAMGYSYFLTQSVNNESQTFTWEIDLETEHILDPILLDNELSLRGCKVTSVTLSLIHI